MKATNNRHLFGQMGFTLIELLIVVAIIGVLVVIAIPQYQIYIAKTQATRIIYELGQLRLTVEECLQTGRNVIGLNTNDCDPRASASNLILGSSQVGITLPNNMGVAQITNPLTLTSSITGTVSNHINPILIGKKVVWLRNNNGSWSCSSNIGTVYLPKSCDHDQNL